MKRIEIKNLNKTFKKHSNIKHTLRSLFTSFFNQGRVEKFHVLSDISFSVDSGDFFGIIGLNGSGKSTLLKLIANIYAPDKGSYLKVTGKVVPFLELGVGFNMELTGRENVYLNGTLLGMRKKYLDKIFDEIVDFADLHEFIDEPVKNYSSGMIVRLAFSIAIQADADIYILDEILAVGDGLFQQKSKDMIAKIIDAGKTVLFVSHDLGSIKNYCNKVAWIEKGKLKFVGDVETGTSLYYQDMVNKEKNEISDSQKRIDELGTGEVTIEKTDAYFDVNKRELRLSANIKINDSYKNTPINVDFGVFSEDWKLIYAFRSSDGGSPFPDGIKTAEAVVKDFSLLAGKYYLNVAVYNDDNSNPYHWKRHSSVFLVENPTQIKKFKYTGFVYFKHQIDYK